MTTAKTLGHITRLIDEHGWTRESNWSDRFGGSLRRDNIIVYVSFTRAGAIKRATRYQVASTSIDRPNKGKQTAVRHWLTERP